MAATLRHGAPGGTTIRACMGLPTPDAIQPATGEQAGADAIVTDDWRRPNRPGDVPRILLGEHLD